MVFPIVICYKIPRNKMNKYAQTTYDENYKMLLNDIKNGLNQWRDILTPNRKN